MCQGSATEAFDSSDDGSDDTTHMSVVSLSASDLMCA